MIIRIFKDKRGSLMEAALVLPILVMLVFLTFDIAEKLVVQNAISSAARESARVYALEKDMNEAKRRGEETFEQMVKGFGNLKSVNITTTADYRGQYAHATVVGEPRVSAFDFAWKFISRKPESTIKRTFVYMMEPDQASGSF